MPLYEVFIPAKPGTDNESVTVEVEASSWLLALRSGMRQIGEQGESLGSIMCENRSDGTIVVKDPTSRRMFRIRELPQTDGEGDRARLEQEKEEQARLREEAEKAAAERDAAKRAYDESLARRKEAEERARHEHEEARQRAAAEAERLRQEEAERAAAEAERVRHEEAERAAEAKRVAEAERLRREEVERAAAEAERKRQEEVARAAAESERKQQEEARKAAEAEHLRQEEARKAAEAERKRQEEARKAAEAERKRQEEDERAAAKAERKRQEEAKKAAEVERKRREEAERAAAKVERKRQEEAARAAIEAARQEEAAKRALQESEARAKNATRLAVEAAEGRSRDVRVTHTKMEALAIETEADEAAEEYFDLDEVLADLFMEMMDVTQMSEYEASSFALDLALRLIKAEAGSVILSDFNTTLQDLYFVAARGAVADQLASIRIPRGKGIVGFSVQVGCPLAVSDVTQNPNFYRAVSEKTGYQTRSILCIPVQYGERTFGAIELINKIGSDRWTPGELKVVHFLAQKLGEHLYTTADRVTLE